MNCICIDLKGYRERYREAHVYQPSPKYYFLLNYVKYIRKLLIIVNVVNRQMCLLFILYYDPTLDNQMLCLQSLLIDSSYPVDNNYDL